MRTAARNMTPWRTITAQSLHHLQPRLLICDEMLCGLDIDRQSSMLTMLQALQERWEAARVGLMVARCCGVCSFPVVDRYVGLLLLLCPWSLPLTLLLFCIVPDSLRDGHSVHDG